MTSSEHRGGSNNQMQKRYILVYNFYSCSSWIVNNIADHYSDFISSIKFCLYHTIFRCVCSRSRYAQLSLYFDRCVGSKNLLFLSYNTSVVILRDKKMHHLPEQHIYKQEIYLSVCEVHNNKELHFHWKFGILSQPNSIWSNDF